MVKYSSALSFLLLLSCVYHDTGEDNLPQPSCDPLTVSWQEDILPIMTASCATTGCHDGITRRDWTDYDEVSRYAQAVRDRTADKSMPFDGPLPQHQIDLISCWVEGGAANN